MDTQVATVVAPLERAAFSIQEFCVRNGISLTTFHKLKNAGLGPKEMRLNTVIRISLDAERSGKKRAPIHAGPKRKLRQRPKPEPARAGAKQPSWPSNHRVMLLT